MPPAAAAPTPTPTPTPISDDARRVSDFMTRLFPAPRAFDIRLWDGTLIPGAGERAADGAADGVKAGELTVVINSPGALRRMLRLPVELALGEAYLRGDFELEGTVGLAGPALGASRSATGSMSEMARLARLWLRLPREKAERLDGSAYGESPARLTARERSRDWDREGIQYHYDAGNDFFQLFLDRRMVYSCAYFPTGTEDLDQAQERKLDHICRKLRLQEGERLLDIGCGWGALVIHAAERYGVRALGVTLSEQQHDLARRRIEEAGLQDRAEVRLADYRDIRSGDAGPHGAFDKIASIGMFEHVGRERLPEYFEHIHALLRPNGLFLNHGIAGKPDQRSRWAAALRRVVDPLLIGGTTFRKRYIFPSGGLVPISEANLVAQRAGLEVRDVENLREHYARTLALWARRLESRRDEAIRVGGERMYRLWRIYMGIGSWQFEGGEFDLGQSLLLRPDGGPSNLPLSRADLYRPTGAPDTS